MRRRDQESFIAAAEEAIDSGWRKLPIFRSDRPTALLKLITAVDDRLRIATLSEAASGASLHVVLRFCQEALLFAIPWVLSACAATDTPIPQTLTDADESEGNELSEYAEGYDSAVIAFTNYHSKRFKAFVASRDRRITFAHASPQIERAELERKAYETRELSVAGKAHASDDGAADALLSLREIVAARATRAGEDRVELVELDSQTMGALRAVRDGVLRGFRSGVEQPRKFVGMEYGKIRRYFASLVALSHAHLFIHVSPAVADIVGGAVSSLALRLETGELTNLLAEIAELNAREAAALSEMFTFDGSNPQVPSICQPLIRANSFEVFVPCAYALGSRFERNFFKLLARTPRTRKEYERFSSSKESIALPRLTALLRGVGAAVRERVPIERDGKRLTDVDLLAYDSRSRFLLVAQHKWLIEPDSVNESKDADAELAKGIEQARLGLDYFASRENARRALAEVPAAGQLAVGAIVISKGSEETGFLPAADVPIVTEEWFVERVGSCSSLAALHELARQRPDRADLARRWRPATVPARLAGYEIRIPGFAMNP